MACDLRVDSIKPTDYRTILQASQDQAHVTNPTIPLGSFDEILHPRVTKFRQQSFRIGETGPRQETGDRKKAGCRQTPDFCLLTPVL